MSKYCSQKKIHGGGKNKEVYACRGDCLSEMATVIVVVACTV
jgi:hypothetical protein